MADDKIMDRLRKLMELSQRGDEHEAQVAAQRAAELMARHEISMAEIEAAKTESPITVEEGRLDAEDGAPYGKREQRWQSILANSCALAVGGKMWRLSGGGIFKFVMVGPRDSINAARYMYMALEKEVNRLGRREMRTRGESNAWRRAYCYGMVSRIHWRLQEGRKAAMDNAGTALVAVSRVEQAVADAFAQKNLRTREAGKLKRPDGELHGWRDGANVNLDGAGRPRLGEGAKKLKS